MIERIEKVKVLFGDLKPGDGFIDPTLPSAIMVVISSAPRDGILGLYEDSESGVQYTAGAHKEVWRRLVNRREVKI